MEKLLSICIPTFNGGETVYHNIKEILNCKSSNFEIIVSDNASTDNTLELLQRIDDDRLKIVTHKKNEQSYLNFYHALMAGSAKYLMLLNDYDRVVVNNLPRYLEFLKNVQYDVIKNVVGKSEELTIAQTQFYNMIYSHPSYVVYRRKAFRSIKPLKCSFDSSYTSYPYIIWDTQVLREYPLETKKSYINGDIAITYTPKTFKDKPSRSRKFVSKVYPSYSYENIAHKFVKYIKILRYLYPKDNEYSKLICNSYRANLYWATTHFYKIMKKPEFVWMKKRYGLDTIDDKNIDYTKLSSDFLKMTIPKLDIYSPLWKVITIKRLEIITIYNKNNFLLNCQGSLMEFRQRQVRFQLNKLLTILVERICK